MFLPIKSFGSTIGLPFLSANEDNQLRFRTGTTGVKRLASAEVSVYGDEGYRYANYRSAGYPGIGRQVLATGKSSLCQEKCFS